MIRRSRYVRQANGCWRWKGATSKKEAGRYGYMRRDGRVEPAHRVMYEDVVGPIPSGHHIHHVCGNTRCVNPAHLQAVPAQTNRMIALRSRP